MPDNFVHNTFFLKQKIERHSFNSSDSAFHSFLGSVNLIVSLRMLVRAKCIK